MDFKQLEAFIYVIKFQSFSKAAEQLCLTQPTISAHISSLEKELNVNLIIRTTKEFCPSEAGKILYEYALDIINLRDRALETISRQKSNKARIPIITEKISMKCNCVDTQIYK